MQVICFHNPNEVFPKCWEQRKLEKLKNIKKSMLEKMFV